MKLHQHIAVSIPISLATYAASRSLPMAAASFIAGVLLDLDHGFDYLREYGFRPDIPFFFRSFHETLYRRVVIPLHGWEWLPLLGVAAILTHGNTIVIGTVIGMAQHLIFDQCTNDAFPWGYFFTWRAMKKFITRKIFRDKGLPV